MKRRRKVEVRGKVVLTGSEEKKRLQRSEFELIQSRVEVGYAFDHLIKFVVFRYLD